MSMYGWIWNISVAQDKEMCRNMCRVWVVCSNRLANSIRVATSASRFTEIGENLKTNIWVTPRWQLYLRNWAHRSRKHFIFPKVKFDETKEKLVTTKENVCRFQMKILLKSQTFLKETLTYDLQIHRFRFSDEEALLSKRGLSLLCFPVLPASCCVCGLK